MQVLFEREALRLFSRGGGFKAMSPKRWVQAAPASHPAHCTAPTPAAAEERGINYHL